MVIKMQLTVGTSVSEMSGVGPARAAALAKLGITNVGQLLRHYPRGYQYRGNIKRLADAAPDEVGSFMLTVSCDPSLSTLKRGMTLVKLRAFDESGTCDVTFFNQPYMRAQLQKGQEYRFFGKLALEYGRLTLSSPVVEKVTDGAALPNLVPVYPLSAGLTQNFISKLISSALKSVGRIPEPLPEKVREENDLCGIVWALRNIHDPPDFETLNAAKKRLIFEELYNFALGAAGNVRPDSGAPAMPDTDLSPLLEILPFEPTGAQKRAFTDIAKDMSSERPMMRLVSGDVGSGKTAVAAAAAYIAVKNGYQCALMAPTEILATQHFNDLMPMFGRLGYGCRLLTGSTKAAEKREITAALADGTLKLVIGTHALISEGIRFGKPGLVICDEQHRFGVGQRETLLEKASPKGGHAHELTMSATPIPRTLAMFLYGSIDMSVLDEMPPGRQKVKTFVVDESYRERLNGFIRRQHDEGHQTYVVCPAVEKPESGEVTQEDIRLIDFGDEEASGKDELKAAATWSETLAESLPDLRVGCVHGKMKPAEKDAVMREFAAGGLDVLVATTVIEVGVNVPNATLMIIENAERFGLSQLHQLRGRVGRGSAASCCVLVSGSKPESRAGKRLAVMKNTFDGFRIAEYDLGERGPGDFIADAESATRQHGELRFRLANLCEDMALLEAAQKAAKENGAKALPDAVTPDAR